MTRDELKQNISMAELIRQYGIHIDRNNFCCCPFHKEKTGSMKIYKASYHCFGCGANGDVFSFVMRMENCDFKTAFKNLGGTYEKSTQYQQKLFKYHLDKRLQKKKINAANREILKKEVSEDIKMQKLYKKVFPVFSDDWCDAVNRLEYDFYLLEELTKRGDEISETIK